MRDKLLYLAWRRYRVPRNEAEDVVQAAIATYLDVYHRYDEEDNQHAILIGIFYKKCLEHIQRSTRDRTRLEKYRRTVEAEAEDGNGTTGASSVLEDIINRENGSLILSALRELRPEVREMFQLLVDEDVGRSGLIEYYGLNKNTLDSRLHLARKQLRQLLQRKGVVI